MLTVDFFPPIVDDAYTYGAISAANSLSDVYAMGGRPVTALNIAAVPEDLPSEIFAQILKGGAEKAAEAGIAIIGGHTVTDDEPKYGMAVTGYIHPDQIVSNASARPGDKLLLTKPIGTGIISTAGKAQEAPEDVLANATEVMATLNRGAAEAMLEVGVNAATDVTGYGLIGHLTEMARGSGVSATIARSAIPVFPGTLDLLSQGFAPGGTHRNLAGVADTTRWADALTDDDKLLLCDAQTSGGLLIAVPADRADELVAAVEASGAPTADVIGEITSGEAGTVEVTA